MISVREVKRPPSAEKIIKQSLFGVVMGLTQTAKEAQNAVQKNLRNVFTIRNRWPEVGPFAIKITPARPGTMQASVQTAADWLRLHEEGGTKTGKSGRLAIPTDEVKRTKRLIIPRSQRPKALRGKGSFIVKTKHGDVIAIRQGRGKRKPIKFLYNLEGSARIKRVPVFFEPIDKVVKRRLHKNVAMNIDKALRNIK